MFLIFFTLMMLPFYLVLRYPFFKLPLHIDTGFYVSNNTICTRRINFSKGWNATYAGCSKIIPEFFYSLIYLIHGGSGYKKFSRFYFSLYNYLTAIAVGYTMYIIGDGSVPLYCIGLVIFCLMSSEPHYGVYFENGEQFEVLPQIIGFLLIILGLDKGNVFFLAGGIGLWALESYFIKLTSLPATIILAFGVSILYPKSIPYLIASLIIASGIYLLWVLKNNKNLGKMISSLIGHEIHLGHKIGLSHYVNQFNKKNKFLWNILRFHPIISVLAIVGFASGNNKLFLIIIYLFAVWGAYLIQVSPIWYYTIPFQPVITCLATLGVNRIIKDISYGSILAIGLLGIWLFIHLKKAYGLSFEQINTWVWLPHSDGMCKKNLMLEKIAPEIRSLIQGQSLFVFGAWNQAYTLMETSYNTNIISAYNWLDTMSPGWMIDLNKQLVENPPQFIFDTENCFNVSAVNGKLGLDYHLVKVWEDQFKLFKLQSVIQNVNPDLECQSYRDINEIVVKGTSFLQRGEYEKATEKFKEVLAIEELLPQAKLSAILGLENCYSMQGKYKEAEERLNEALSLKGIPDSSRVFAHYNLGSMYERKGNYEKAKDLFETILALGRNIKTLDGKKLSGNTHFHLGCIYQSLGERERAKREFKDCLKLIPDHKKAKQNLKGLE
ncbi:tetratricopeptide repeat protein [bacterium]|nr:tetratricopeptide repeat protein [bacterium]